MQTTKKKNHHCRETKHTPFSDKNTSNSVLIMKEATPLLTVKYKGIKENITQKITDKPSFQLFARVYFTSVSKNFPGEISQSLSSAAPGLQTAQVQFLKKNWQSLLMGQLGFTERELILNLFSINTAYSSLNYRNKMYTIYQKSLNIPTYCTIKITKLFPTIWSASNRTVLRLNFLEQKLKRSSRLGLNNSITITLQSPSAPHHLIVGIPTRKNKPFIRYNNLIYTVHTHKSSRLLR